MNNQINTINQAVKELKDKIESAKKELKGFFDSSIVQLFNEHKTVKRLEIYLNNHEWSDGDQTSFYLSYDDLKLITEDELGNETETDGYGEETEENEKIRDQFVDLFKSCDIDSFYEDNFNEESGTLEFSVKNGKLEVK